MISSSVIEKPNREVYFPFTHKTYMSLMAVKQTISPLMMTPIIEYSMELSQILYIKLTLGGVMFHLEYLSVIGQSCCYGYCLKILILYLGPVHILSKI